MHVGANEITKIFNTLNTVKKCEKKVENSLPNTILVLSTLILRSDKKDISKGVSDVNGCLKNYCNHKNLDFIDNHNIT